MITLNPRSLYNKQSNFCTLIEQTEADLCFVSESWDRSHVRNGELLSDLIQISGFKWIKNVCQRRSAGGKPAILIKEKDFFIKELCPDVITVPVGVEAVWALLTPKAASNRKFKHIAIASVYYSSNYTRKDDFIDHISETFHILCSKYGPELKFIIAGDFNRLRVKPILSLSPDMKQIVQVPTRRNPDATLDLIFTNIAALYSAPTTLPPLENDDNCSGMPSDHLIVVAKPISNSSLMQNKKTYKKITFRPFPESAINDFGRWIQSQNWSEVYNLNCPNLKAEKFEKILMEKINLFFPEKTMKINSNDQPWIDAKLVNIDRKRKREYNLRKRSPKWKKLDKMFNERSSILKKQYYKNRVEDLKSSNTSQWYSKIRRMSSIDQEKENEVHVEELNELSSQAQADTIAEHFARIANLYEPLKSDDIELPNMANSAEIPLFEPHQVHKKIQKMKKKSSTILKDIPWKIIREFSVELAEPLCNIFNSASLVGTWPQLWKHEIVTPIPKKFPPKSKEDLRRISGTKNFSKVYEALLSETIIKDIQPSISSSQYGNQKGLSTTHYLVNMVHRILTILDSNNAREKYAVIAQLVDWSKAFDRVDSKLGIEAFIANGVRPAMVPILTSFFQNRQMTVKWKGCLSQTKTLPGGVPQGSSFGNIQYTVFSNDNAAHVPSDMNFKFVDDLSILEKLNLIIAGLSSYNFQNHVASDIAEDHLFLPTENNGSQQSLNSIETWTSNNKAKLNIEKSSYMIFNFSDLQFSTRLYLENTLLEEITETKLLGTIISSDIRWHKNTELLVQKAYKRMQILHKLVSFGVNREDLKEIYILYIRSVLELNCPVWHFSLTDEENTSLERIQKIACRLILKSDYQDYQQALRELNLETLNERRTLLSVNFAKKCCKHPTASSMFPQRSPHVYSTRHFEKYFVQPARTARLRNSAIPQMQRALNANTKHK